MNISGEADTSASINKNEILNNSYLNCFNSVFAPVVPTVNSLTEMYTYSDDLVHPFSMVKYKKINEAIDSWDFTVYRCITPKVLIEYCNIINYTLEYDDIKNIKNYIDTVRKILNIIKNSTDEIKKNICDLKLENYNNNIQNFKTLYLTSSIVGSSIDTFLFFTIAFYATGIPWFTLALGDLAVKMFVALLMLVPFRLLLKTFKPV